MERAKREYEEGLHASHMCCLYFGWPLKLGDIFLHVYNISENSAVKM
jgi:hypothetical protein